MRLLRSIFILSMLCLTACQVAHIHQRHWTRRYARNGIEGKWFQNDEHHMRYWEGGAGRDTVVLLHGFVGDAQITWNRTMLNLAKDHYVLAPDLLWISPSTSTRAPDLDSQVDAVHDLLKLKGVHSAAFVGISYGGFVEFGMLQHHPEMVEKLCIVDSPGITYKVSQLDSLSKRAGVERVNDIFIVDGGEGVKKMLKLAMHRKLPLPPMFVNDIYDLYFSFHHTERGQLIESLIQEADRFDTLEVDAALPVRVIFGEHDPVFPLAVGQELANHLNAEFVTIPKAAHAPNFENFSAFKRAVREFLDEEK